MSIMANRSDVESRVESKDAAGLVLALTGSMHTSQSCFKELQGRLGLLMWGQGAVLRPQESLKLVLDCLSLLISAMETEQQPKGNGNPTSICHMLIELVSPGSQDQQDLRSCAAIACELLEKRCLTPSNARLAVKLVQNFNLSSHDIKDWKALVAFVAVLLADRSTFSPSVTLMMHLEGLDAEFDKTVILGELVAEGLESAAESWVNKLGKEYQAVYVEQCIAQDRLKAASRAVRTFGLQEDFPDVESMYRHKTVGRLLGKRLWSVATSFVGNDVALQTIVLKQMVESGEAAMAEEHCSLFGLPPDVLQLDPAAMAAEEVSRLARYLQLPFPAGNLILVDSREKLEVAAPLLSEATLLGIDVEWKPFHMTSDGPGAKGGGSPASIMQVSTETHVLVFDLLVLGTDPHLCLELDTCLCAAFHNKSALKIGFQLAGDLGKLASSYPALAAFARVESVLDLSHMWVAHLESRPGAGMMSLKVQRSAGLSTLSQTLLGKPLDKSMQVSDWEARPLSSRQFRYACLDATVLILLYRHFEGSLASFQSVISSKAYTYVANVHKRPGSGGGSRGGGGGGGGGGGKGDDRNGAALGGSLGGPDSLDEAGSSGPGPGGGGGGSGSGGNTASSPGNSGLMPGAVLSCSVLPSPLLAARSPSARSTAAQPVGNSRSSFSDCSVSQLQGAAERDVADSGPGVSAGGPLQDAELPQSVERGRSSEQPLTWMSSTQRSCLSAHGSTSSRQCSQVALEDVGRVGCSSIDEGARVLPCLVETRLAQLGLLAAFTWLSSDGLLSGTTVGTLATALGAACALGVPASRVAKSVALMAGAQPWIVVARGNARLDMQKVASIIGISRRRVKIASAEDCWATFGYQSGCLPPFGHPLNIPVIVDAGLRPGSLLCSPGACDSLLGVGPCAAILAASVSACGPLPVGPSPGSCALLVQPGAAPAGLQLSECSRRGVEGPLPWLQDPGPQPGGLLPEREAPAALAAAGTELLASCCWTSEGAEESGAGSVVGLSVGGAAERARSPAGMPEQVSMRCGSPGEGVDVSLTGEQRAPDSGLLRQGRSEQQQQEQQPQQQHQGQQQQEQQQQQQGDAAGAVGDDAANPVPSSRGNERQWLQQLQDLQPTIPPTSPSNMLFCGAGDPAAYVCITYDQLLLLSGGRAEDVAEEERGGGAGGAGLAATAAGLATKGEASLMEVPEAAITDADMGLAAGGARHRQDPCFLLDTMLGRLGRWLRCLGVDTLDVDQHLPRDQMIKIVAQATAVGRVLLTRDSKLVSRRDCGAAYLLHSSDPEAQLREVAHHYGITMDKEQVLSRCPKCNAAAFRLVPPESVRSRVTDHVYDMVKEFFECGSCLKIFWMGPKSFSAISLVEGIISQTKTPGMKAQI